MVKKVAKEEKEFNDDSSEYDEEDDLESGEEEGDEASVDSDIMIAARDAAEKAENSEANIVKKFGLKEINDEEGMKERLQEIQ